MPSPFPGMDPYLEGYLWPDVHHRLATEISRQLAPRLRPRYVARLEVYVVEDSSPETEIGVMYPDVEVLQVQRIRETGLPGMLTGETAAGQSSPTSPTTTASLILPLLEPVDVQVASVEVRDAAGNHLITSIEILSPVNKRDRGLTLYRQKRQRLYEAGVHLLEIDLLRRGTRALVHPRLPDMPYLLTLTRAGMKQVEVWPVSLRERLPTLPVPLRPPDADVALDLAAALTAIYDEAAYDLSIDYTQPPPPPALAAEDATWVQSWL